MHILCDLKKKKRNRGDWYKSERMIFGIGKWLSSKLKKKKKQKKNIFRNVSLVFEHTNPGVVIGRSNRLSHWSY